MIVEQFLHWVTTATPEKRAKATHALARAYLVSEMDDEERTAAEAAMTFLLDDPDLRVRAALADVLLEEEQAPRHIILGLLEDIPDISLSIAAFSPVLIDSELVDLVATHGLHFQIAVASRKPVSASIAAAIAEIAPAEACRYLLENPDANILPSTFLRLAERFGKDEVMQQVLLNNPHLPVAAHQLIIANMSEALSLKAVRQSRMEVAEAEKVSREARDRATLALIRNVQVEELPELVEHLRQTSQLTTVLLLRTICAGQVDFFIEALALLSKVPRKRILALLNARSGKTLQTVYKKAGLPNEAYPAFAIAFDVYVEEGAVDAVEDQYRFTRIMIERILERYRGVGPSGVDEILAMLRRFASETARDAAREYVHRHLETGPNVSAA